MLRKAYQIHILFIYVDYLDLPNFIKLAFTRIQVNINSSLIFKIVVIYFDAKMWYINKL